jgi:hypothetical protein
MAKAPRKKQLNLTFYIDHHNSIRNLQQRLLADPRFINDLDKLLAQPTGPQRLLLEERLARLEQALSMSDSAKAIFQPNLATEAKVQDPAEMLPVVDQFVDRRHKPPRVWPAGVREIYRQFAAGKTDRQIGESLGLARRTINKRRHRWEKSRLTDQWSKEEA